MCKSRKSTDVTHSIITKSHPSKSSSENLLASSLSSSSCNYPKLNYPSSSSINYYSSALYKGYKDTSKSSSSSSSISAKRSLKSLEEASLPDNPNIYDFAEICRATNNFLSEPFSSSPSSTPWRCQIRQKDVILFQRKFRRVDPIRLSELQQLLSTICRSHHNSLIKLLGVATSGNCIFLVYEYVHGASLATCLRNPQNPSYTVLSNWLSRMHM